MTVRVAIVTPALGDAGGVQALAAFLHRTLADSGRYRPELVTVATSARDAASVRLLAPATWLRGVRTEQGVWNGHPFRHVGALAAELEFQRYRSRGPLAAQLGRYDIIHVVGGTPAWALVAADSSRPLFLYVATLARSERRSLLARAHGVTGRWQRRMTRITERLDLEGIRRSDVVLVINEWMLDHVRAERPGAPADTVACIPPGVDTELFAPSRAGRGTYLLSVGRLADPRKNLRLLFEVYAQLRRSVPAAPRLVLVGRTPPLPEDWQFAVARGLAEHVDVRVDTSSAELAELYRGASIFLLSSDEEGLGIVLLEAMASGLPVVSTRCGGPETCVVDGETGYLVPVGDAAALADRVSQLLAHPARRARMGAAGRRRVEEDFSLAAAGRAVLAVYDSYLARANEHAALSGAGR